MCCGHHAVFHQTCSFAVANAGKVIIFMYANVLGWVFHVIVFVCWASFGK